MEFAIVGLILVFNGALYWKLQSDDTFLQEYVRTSPKAWIWRKLFGRERAAHIIRTRLLPLGMVLWVIVLGVMGVSVLTG